MSAVSTNADKVLPAPRRPRSWIVFGEEAILAPKASFQVSIGESDEELARWASVHARIAESNARAVLDNIANESDRRSVRFPQTPGVWCQAGLANLARGDYDSARKAFGTALRLDPVSRTARLGLARVANETEHWDEALEILRSLQKENPGDLEIVVALGVVIARTQGIPQALAELDREPPVSPRAASFFAARGSLRVANQEYSRAISDLRKVIRMKPDWVHARNVLGIAELKAGRASDAEQRFREAVRIAPTYLEAFLNLLRVKMQNGEWSAVLELSLERYPDIRSAPAKVGRIASQAALESGEWGLAKAWLESALGKTEEERSRARLLNDLGVALSRLDKHAEAERRFAESVETLPTELAVLNRGKALLSAGSPAEAASWLKFGPTPDGVLSRQRQETLAVALNEAKFHSDAAAVYEALIDTGEADADTFAGLSAIYTDNLSDPDGGALIARKGLGLFPEHAILLNNLAYALLMAGRVDEAALVLDREIEVKDSDKIYLLATRGLLELRRGDVAGGQRLYDEASRISQKDAVRDRLRAKRNLELGRALLRQDGASREATRLLSKAAASGELAYPYQEHAQAELLRLGAGPSPDISDESNDQKD